MSYWIYLKIFRFEYYNKDFMLKGTYELRTYEDMGKRYEAQLLNKQYIYSTCKI